MVGAQQVEGASLTTQASNSTNETDRDVEKSGGGGGGLLIALGYSTLVSNRGSQIAILIWILAAMQLIIA